MDGKHPYCRKDKVHLHTIYPVKNGQHGSLFANGQGAGCGFEVDKMLFWES